MARPSKRCPTRPATASCYVARTKRHLETGARALQAIAIGIHQAELRGFTKRGDVALEVMVALRSAGIILSRKVVK